MSNSRTEILQKMESPVAILGSGVTGKALENLVMHLGGSGVVYAEDAGGLSLDQEAVEKHELFLYSPGFRMDHPWLNLIRQAKKTLLPELDFSALFWEGKIIAVTGTNGKTTITDFVDQVLSAEGICSKAVGNIGKPFADIVPIFTSKDDWAVCEVSSFQSESIEIFSPDYVIWTNLTDDHQDRHGTMKRYFDCKWRLVERCRGISLLGHEVYALALMYEKEIPLSALCIHYEDDFPVPKDSPFARLPQKNNYQIACALLADFNVPQERIDDVARSFLLPKHRLSKIMELGGVSFWNDSKATNFGAALAALHSFKKPVHWIGGGISKNGNIGRFVKELSGLVSHAYLIGSTTEELSLHLTEMGITNRKCFSVNEAVEKAFNEAGEGDHIVFSPGFASFDMFKNYAARGDEFIRVVERMRNLVTNKEGTK